RPEKTQPDEEQLRQVDRPNQRVTEEAHDGGGKDPQDDDRKQDRRNGELELREAAKHQGTLSVKKMAWMHRASMPQGEGPVSCRLRWPAAGRAARHSRACRRRPPWLP